MKLSDGTKNSEPSVTGKIPNEGCVLGIDIGSTSTNLVLIDKVKKLVVFSILEQAVTVKMLLNADLTV